MLRGNKDSNSRFLGGGEGDANQSANRDNDEEDTSSGIGFLDGKVTQDDQQSQFMRQLEQLKPKSRETGDEKQQETKTRDEASEPVGPAADQQAMCRDHVEDAVAQALASLSAKEREEVFLDIHGIVDVYTGEEDPQWVNQQLKKLDEQLDDCVSQLSYSTSNSCAYEQARDMSSTYVQRKDFRLLFLRAERWDSRRAAQRMIGFMEQKLHLFGRQKLCQEITIHDLQLDEKDRQALECGFVQRVPHLDRSGRNILAIYPHHFPTNVATKSVLRAFYYVYMSVVQEGIRAQKLGFVELEYQTSWWGCDTQRSDILTNLLQLRPTLPIRTAAAHSCTNDPTYRRVFDAAKQYFPPKCLGRIKVHFGHYHDVQQELSSYGIPVSALPIDSETGQWHTNHHRAWLEQQQQLETNKQNTNLDSEREIFERDHPNSWPSFLSASPFASNSTTMEVQNLKTEFSFCIDQSADQSHRAFERRPSSSNQGDEDFEADGPSTTAVAAADPPITSSAWEQDNQDSESTLAATIATKKSSSTSNIILKPSESDVVLGRGFHIDNRPGNIQFRNLLGSHLERYSQSYKFQKTVITESILQELREMNIRFVKQASDGNCWAQVDDKTVRDKISRTFRRIRESSLKTRGSGGGDEGANGNNSSSPGGSGLEGGG